MKLSPYFSSSLSSRSSSLSSRSSLLPHRIPGLFDLSVSIISSPFSKRRGERKDEKEREKEYTDSVVRKWEVEFEERENKKRNREDRTIVQMRSLSENKIHISIFHSDNNILNFIIFI